MSYELVPSQEAALPAVPTGRNTRGRAQTRKTKLVEHTTQEEDTHAGDHVEIHQVRQGASLASPAARWGAARWEVQEVVKKVAVVRKGRGRRHAAQRQEEEEAERATAAEGEEATAEGEEEAAAPSRRVTRRMDAELKQAMERDLEAMAGTPGGAHRTWKRVVVEGGTAPEPSGMEGEGEEEGGEVQVAVQPEQPPGGSQAAPARRSTRTRSQPRFHAEAVATGMPPGEALEPRVPSAVLEEAMKEIGQEGQEEAEAEAEDLAHGEEEAEEEGKGQPAGEEEGHAEPELYPPPEDLAALEATPEDLLMPTGRGAGLASQEAAAEVAEQEEAQQEEAQEKPPAEAAALVSPSTRRKRKAPGVDVAAAATEPVPAGLPGGGRATRRGRLFASQPERAVAAEAPAQAAAEEEEAAPAEGGEGMEEEVAGAQQEEELEEVEGEEEEQEMAEGEEGQAAEPAQPSAAREAVLGAAGAVGTILRSVLGGGRAQAEERPRTATKVPAAQAPAAKGGVGKKGGKKAQRRGGGKGREESYKRYVHRVLQQVHPGLNISSRAMEVMQSFMVDAFDRVAAEASHLTRHGKHKTLTAREVQTAVKLVVPGELGRHAVTEGKKAVARFSGLQ